jgi:hypothetical protein
MSWRFPQLKIHSNVDFHILRVQNPTPKPWTYATRGFVEARFAGLKAFTSSRHVFNPVFIGVIRGLISGGGGGHD